MDVSSSSASGVTSPLAMQGQRRLGAKMDVVYSLLSMLGSTEGHEDMSTTLLSMSNSVDSCLVMRQSGCLPLLIQLIHAPNQVPQTRERASRALYNIVHAKNDEKLSRREARVLRLLEQIRDFCQIMRTSLESRKSLDESERHPGTTIATLMKLSFDESHRYAMCQLGGLHAVAELVEVDHAVHGSKSTDPNCITLRRYAGMALTNLTFGDGNNKALLCSFRDFMKSLVTQLCSPSDDLRQVTASVLRNLSWRADSSSKQTLREIGAVVALMKAAMEGRKESTLKSILSALWNLSAHCSTNKIDICAVEGALAFLVDMLSYNAPSKTLAIIENAGGILRNVSSHIAVRDDYRAVVRERGCLQVLLRQLRSPSLTVVSNACGTLWNLSARCTQDQRLLWDLGAVPMLRSLVHSKHKMISMGSSAALKNLLSARPQGSNLSHLDSTARGLGLPSLPSLAARRQKALEQEIDRNLAETCDNIEPSTSPINKADKFSFKLDKSMDGSGSRSFYQMQAHSSTSGQPRTSGMKFTGCSRSESRESMRSVTSTHSDTIFENINRQAESDMIPSDVQMKQQSTSLHSTRDFNAANLSGENIKSSAEKKYTLRYANAIPKHLKAGSGKYTSTTSWATTPNQEPSSSKDLLYSSLEDNLSLESADIKTDGTSKSNTYNFPKVETGSSASCITNHNLVLNNLEKMLNLEQSKDEDHASDDNKLSSGYFTSTDHEQDSDRTYNIDKPNQSSINSSRTSTLNLRNETQDSKTSSKVSSAVDSLRSISVDTTSEYKSLESDSNNVEGGKKLKYSYKRCSLGSFMKDTSKTKDNEDQLSQSKLVRHKTNTNLNDIDSKDDSDVTLTQDYENIQDNEESTYNDYFTVEETYVVDKDAKIENHKEFAENDINTSKACSPTLSFMTIDDVDYDAESSEYGTDNMHTAAANLESESCESFNSIERSEHALLELCIKPKAVKPDVQSLTSFPLKFHLGQDAIDTGSINSTSTNKNEVTGEYRRQRDPDAMIASLDRLTATLVQQTEAMRERDSGAMRASLLSDTWNEESPNDVSFPSISMSVPLVASFKSDIQDDSINKSLERDDSMTESKIIQIEANKLAKAVSAEVNQVSLASLNLDEINPPSTMGSLVSLTASLGGVTDNADNNSISEKNMSHSTTAASQSLTFNRKRSIPVGVVARRALGQCQNRTGSLESLLNECNSSLSQIDNVKPPSIMDELLDIGDMESSMVSVASITSEIADCKDNSLNNSDADGRIFDLSKPVTNFLASACTRYIDTSVGSANNSLSECLENINPPSLMNEVCQMDESSEAKPLGDNTLCLDSELYSEEATHCVFDERIEEMTNDTDDAATPISSENCSSLESTPKKRHIFSRPGHLTPKQKRQLAKERYKTYTIAAERVKKEQEELKKQEQISGVNSLISKCSPLSKLTPKQRRQEDRSRFQTQVLAVPKFEIPSQNEIPVESESSRAESNVEKSNVIKTGIPMLKKFNVGKQIPRFNRSLSENKEKQSVINMNILSSLESESKDEDTCVNGENNILSNDTVNNEISKIGNNSNAKSSNQISSNAIIGENFIIEDLDNLEESQSDNENDSSEKEEAAKGVKGPRIVKPGMLSRDLSVESNGSDKSETEIPKPIRGKRKPLYSTPTTKKSIPQSSPSRQVASSAVTPLTRNNTSPIVVRPTRATTLRQHNSLQKSNSLSKMSPNNNAAQRNSVPQKSSSTTSNKFTKRFSTPLSNNDKVNSMPKLERQGTFTKDEPEMENVPTVLPMSPAKFGYIRSVSSDKKLSPKATPIQTKSKQSFQSLQKPSTPKLKKTTSVEKINTSIPMIAKRSSTNLCSSAVKKSSSNYQIAPANESGIPRKISMVQRSNSNSSIVSNSSTQDARSKMVKEATSKIANLWKKVEQNKTKQRFEKPDTRQWIRPNRESDEV